MKIILSYSVGEKFGMYYGVFVFINGGWVYFDLIGYTNRKMLVIVYYWWFIIRKNMNKV